MINDILSDILIINTGGPQGCVLSAVLFTIYTNALRSRFGNCVLINENMLTTQSSLDWLQIVTKTIMKPRMLWCQSHNLFLNVAKTKEIIFEFRHSNITYCLTINNDPVEICETFKYLGITIDSKLTRSKLCAAVVSKCRQRLFFLRLLN
jgi:hypothetical protein